MITVVTFLWKVDGAVPHRYGAEHVNRLRAALAYFLTIRHRVVCVTPDPTGIDRRIEHVPMTQALVDRSRARFLKLSFFRRDAADLFGGERIMLLDLDVTPVGDMVALVRRTEDFVIWRDPLFGREGYADTHRYNSSLILMNAGCRPQVYETFDISTSQQAIKNAGLVGSDQAWIGLTLGPHEAVWTQDDGVLGFKHDLGGKMTDPQSGRRWPSHARLIVSHGRPKPWELDADHPLRLVYERNGREAVAA